MSLGDREGELLDTLEAVVERDLPYVLVGGWAIAAFDPRFTTDVDVVVPSRALEDYADLLTDRGYEQTADVTRNERYEGRTIRFEKDVGNPVAFDAMVDVLGCRQTGAEWSYRYLTQHSVADDLRAGRAVSVRIPEPELLFAVKLHSGRTADTRDLVVLATDADLDRVVTHLRRGDPENLVSRIDAVLDRMQSDGFDDAFKGVFERQSVPTATIETVVEFLEEQRRRLDAVE